MKTAFLFPGQGAQSVGMGRDLYEAFPAAQRVFDLAEAASGLPLKRVCFEGPADEAARTDLCQPAIFTVSAATLAVLDDVLASDRLEAIRPAYLAGLSLGEYTALYAADAIDLAETVKLVALRGRAMQDAATAVPSGMVSVLGLDADQAEKLCTAARQDQVLVCANFNCPGQVVFSGEVDACRRVEALAGAYGAAGAVPLKVAGAFHSDVMTPAVEKLAEALGSIRLARPRVPVIANVDARPYHKPEDIMARLLDQLVRPVRWQQSMEYLLAEGVQAFYEIGPGRVLAGLMRRISRQTKVTCINGREAIEKLAANE